MQAMVLAAGLGTRLRPLTERRAKPAVPFLGVPLIRTLVRQLRAAGFHRIVVNLFHHPESVRAALSGETVTFSSEVEPLGTAGGPGLALERGLLNPTEPLLVVNGKIHTDLDFATLWREHVTSRTSITMALVENQAREAFREVRVHDGRVVGFGRDRAPSGPKPLAFTGAQVLGPTVLQSLKPTPSDTVRDVHPRWIQARQVRAFASSDRWWEFSTPERYLGLHAKARRLGLPETHPEAFVDPSAEIFDSVLWEDVCIGRGARLCRCIVLSGARVPPGTSADHVVLGPSRDGSAIERSRLDPALVARAAGP